MRLLVLVAALSALSALGTFASGCGAVPVSVDLVGVPYTHTAEGVPVIRVGDTARVNIFGGREAGLSPGVSECDVDGTTLVPSAPGVVSIAPDTEPLPDPLPDAEVTSPWSKRFLVTGLSDGTVTLVGTCGGLSGDLTMRVGVPGH